TYPKAIIFTNWRRLLEEDDNKEVGIYNVEDNEGAIINHQIRKQIIIQDDLNQ
ncbi:4717_t:CDS:1, partial [Entrophospora sp. SA101]